MHCAYALGWALCVFGGVDRTTTLWGNLSIKVNGRQSGEHHERHRRHRTKTWGAVLLAVVWRAYHASRRHSNAQANFACAHIRLLWDVDKCVSDYLLPTASFSTRLCAQSKREGS